MPDASTAPAGQAAQTAPEINDSLPANAEVLSGDDDQISALLARFGMGPEVAEEPAPVPAGAPVAAAPTATTAEVDPNAALAEVPTAGEPVAGTAPAPDVEALVTQRVSEQLAAKTKEFEPILAERDALAAQVEDLTAKLTAQTNPAPMPKEIDALMIEDDFNVLSKMELDAEKLLEWCDAHEETGYTPAKDGETAYSSAEIRKMRRTVEKRMTALLPQARQLAQTRAQKRTEARKAYPELFDGKSDAHKIRVGMKARAPWIYAVFPQFDLWLGHMLEGEKAFNARQGGAAATAPATGKSSTSAATAPAPKPPTPPVLPKPGGAPTPTTGRRAAPGIDTGKYVELVNSGVSGRNALVSVIRGLN